MRPYVSEHCSGYIIAGHSYPRSPGEQARPQPARHGRQVRPGMAGRYGLTWPRTLPDTPAVRWALTRPGTPPDSLTRAHSWQARTVAHRAARAWGEARPGEGHREGRPPGTLRSNGRPPTMDDSNSRSKISRGHGKRPHSVFLFFNYPLGKFSRAYKGLPRGAVYMAYISRAL